MFPSSFHILSSRLRDRGVMAYSLLALILAGVLMWTGCGPAASAPPVTPTRTPKPTFTFTPIPTATPLPVGTPHSHPTPEPTATFTPLPRTTSNQSATATPTLPPPRSPAVKELPKTGRALLIDQDRQQMYVFENGIHIRTIPVSTGEAPTRTKPWKGIVGNYHGTFFAYGTYADYAWYLYDDNGAVLIHSLPYTITADGQRIYEGMDALGRYPSSHGCIRIHPDDANWLTFWGPKGAAVIITPWTGD